MAFPMDSISLANVCALSGSAASILKPLAEFLRYGVLPAAILLLFGSLALSFRRLRRIIEELGEEFEEIGRKALAQARRLLILATGGALLLVGIAMIVLPGPALVVVPLALAILGTEFVWARRLLARVRNDALKIAERVKAAASQK